MRHHSVFVLTMCGLALTQWIVAGVPSCQDKSPDVCRSISCKQQGFEDMCRRTCGLCTEECRSGFFNDGFSCRKCQDGVDVQSVDYRRKCGVPCNQSSMWDTDCRTPCSRGCRNQTCHRWNGHCYNCKPGYYGPTCELSCDSCRQCWDRVDACDNEGRCLCGCRRGKRGDKCDQGCPHCEMCSGNNCTCQEGFRGDVCSETCVNCKSCTETHCTCKTGFYGDTCTVPCPQHCSLNVCGQDGECTRDCEVGWYGPSCDIPCTNCVGGRCSVNGTCTAGCKPGFYGDRCKNTCKTGFHGDTCMTCPLYCTKCEQYGDKCLTCQQKHFGYKCEKLCSSGCKGGICQHETGICSQGCVGTFYGHFCNNSCSDQCVNTYCHTGDTDVDRPQCTDGCEDGWWGDYCDNTCPLHCVKCDRHLGQCLECEVTRYGEYCNLTCNPSCVKSQCNLTGDCILGCESGHYGSRCSERCPQTCDTCQHDGACLTCGEEPYSLHRQTRILYAVIAVLVSVVLIMTALFIKRHVVNRFAGIYISPVLNDLESRSDNISLEQLGESRDSDYRHYEMIQNEVNPQAAGPDEEDDEDDDEVSVPRLYEPLRPAEDSVEYSHLATLFD